MRNATLTRIAGIALSAREIHPSKRKAPLHGDFSRADDGDRTRDPQLGKLMLYQLSYVRARDTIPRPAADQRCVIATGVPSGRMRASRRIARFVVRMHPWLTSCPRPDGSFVPWRPIRPSPPNPKLV